MKMIAFWDIALCSLAEAGRRFRGAHRPNDEGSTNLRNIDIILRDYT
jgi:hypothetical protein